MGALDSLQEKNAREQKLPENFLIQVTGYSQFEGRDKAMVDTVQGVRLDTGAKVSVMLSVLKDALAAGKERPTIAKMKCEAGTVAKAIAAVPSDMRGQTMKIFQHKVEPGGVMAVDAAWNNGTKDGVENYSARWLNSVSKYANEPECKVIPSALVRVDNARIAPDGSVNMTLTVADVDAAVKVDSKTIASQLTAVLAAENEYGSPRAIVRLYEPAATENQAKGFEVGRAGKLDDNGAFVFEPIEQSVAKWLDSDLGKAITGFADASHISVEVIPASRVSYGKNAKEKLAGMSEEQRVSHNRVFRDKKNEACFTQAYVCLRRVGNPDGGFHSYFVTGARPLAAARVELMHARALPTPVAAPKLAEVAAAGGDQPPVTSDHSDHSDHQGGADDIAGDFSLDDVVGPAETAPRERVTA